MIKKFLTAAMLCAATLTVSAQKPSTVQGDLNFDKLPLKPVKLFKVVEGKCVQIAEAEPTAEGKFGFLFYPTYEGLYVIGVGNEGSPNYNHDFYFKPGDKLSVDFTDEGYSLVGDNNSKENKVLGKWHNAIATIYQKAINFMLVRSTYVDFFPQLESTVKANQNWFNGKHTGNAKFDAAMPGIMKMDMAMVATNFLQTPRSAHPSVEEYSAYYSTLKDKNFTQNTALIYQYPWGIRTMNGLASVNYRQSGGSFKNFDLVKDFSAFIANDTLKGEIVLNKASGLKDYGAYKQLAADYGKYILTPSQQKRFAEAGSKLAVFKPGDEAFNFNYEDTKGNMVSLASMKGKVVLVDVWATWCGPCKAELPYLKKLEEEMKGTDVQFVSISVDEVKDKKKWLHFIDTAHLGGTQLFAGGWSNDQGVTKYYKIKGIPRFLVFDKQGKIVSVDAPRPSNPELKKMLESELKK